MVLTVHHLQVSQSERIPWLCEELSLPYTLVLHTRDPIFSPPSLKAITPLGQAPVLQDGDLTLMESAACVEYICQVHGHGALVPRFDPSSSDNDDSDNNKTYASSLFWFHFANGSLQPLVQQLLVASAAFRSQGKTPEPGSYVGSLEARLHTMLAYMDGWLCKGTENVWLAGQDFSAADIMAVWTLTTMRVFYAYDLSRYQGILGYLKRVSERPAYLRAREKADRGLGLMIDGPAPKHFMQMLKESGKSAGL